MKTKRMYALPLLLVILVMVLAGCGDTSPLGVGDVVFSSPEEALHPESSTGYTLVEGDMPVVAPQPVEGYENVREVTVYGGGQAPRTYYVRILPEVEATAEVTTEASAETAAENLTVPAGTLVYASSEAAVSGDVNWAYEVQEGDVVTLSPVTNTTVGGLYWASVTSPDGQTLTYYVILGGGSVTAAGVSSGLVFPWALLGEGLACGVVPFVLVLLALVFGLLPITEKRTVTQVILKDGREVNLVEVTLTLARLTSPEELVASLAIRRGRLGQILDAEIGSWCQAVGSAVGLREARASFMEAARTALDPETDHPFELDPRYGWQVTNVQITRFDVKDVDVDAMAAGDRLTDQGYGYGLLTASMREKDSGMSKEGAVRVAQAHIVGQAVQAALTPLANLVAAIASRGLSGEEAGDEEA